MMMDRVNYTDLELNPDGIFLWHGEPFTGTAFELFPDGQLHREVEMFEGEADGYWRKHFRYDQRQVDGTIGGHYTWTRDSCQLSSGPASEVTFQIKETIWDEVGKIVSADARLVASIPHERMNVDDLKTDTDSIFYRDGHPFTGIGFTMDPHGQLATEREILDGQVTGLTREWFPSGERKSDGYTSLSGFYRWVRAWFPNGALQRESVSGDGVPIQEILWNEAGEVISSFEGPRLVTSSGH